MRGKNPHLQTEPLHCSKAKVLVVADLKPKILLPDVSDTPKECRGWAGRLKSGRQNASRLTPHASPSTSLLGGHSEVDPRLPIPNRTVKRLSADASADCPRESRSPPGAPKNNPQGSPLGVCFFRLFAADLRRLRKHPPANLNRSGRPACHEAYALTGVCFSAGYPGPAQAAGSA